jgi:hypothetical protein
MKLKAGWTVLAAVLATAPAEAQVTNAAVCMTMAT